MLVLSRKRGQKILIGDDIEIVTVKVGDGSVRIGVRAPREMRIIREELLERKEVPVARLLRIGDALPGAKP